MELPGNRFIPFIGAVEQTLLTAIGTTTPYKMSRADVDPEAETYDVTSNAGLLALPGLPAAGGAAGFKAAIPTNRICRIRMTQASFDPLINPWGVPLSLKEGDYIRLAIAPFGGPVFGLNASIVVGQAFLFPAVLITKLPWRPDANAGQPIDFECQTVVPYSCPGETAVSFTP